MTFRYCSRHPAPRTPEQNRKDPKRLRIRAITPAIFEGIVIAIGLIISKNLSLYHKICLNLMIYCLFFIFYKTTNIKLFEIIYLFIEKIVISSRMNILKFKKDNCIN